MPLNPGQLNAARTKFTAKLANQAITGVDVEDLIVMLVAITLALGRINTVTAVEDDGPGIVYELNCDARIRFRIVNGVPFMGLETPP